MLGKPDFIKCVVDALKERGFGPKRAGEIVDDYKWRVADYEAQGVASNDAATRAMTDTFNHVATRNADKAAGMRKNIYVLAEGQKRITFASGTNAKGEANVRTSGFFFDGKAWNGPGTAIARAIYSMISADGRFKGTAFEASARIRANRYWSLFSDVLDDFSKGAFGRQLGGVHFPNIVRELHGEHTGDGVAKSIADTYTIAQNLMVDDMRLVGGAIDKRKDYRLAQRQNPVKVARAGMDRWVDDHMKWLDWDHMRFPDGDTIPVADRERVLQETWRSLRSDGRSKIDPKVGRGRGASIGNAIDNHRFLIYKDADSWTAQHSAYGEGTVFDVVANHIQSMSKRIALVDHFGRNPELMLQALTDQGEKAAAQIAEQAKVDKGVWTAARREAGIRAQADYKMAVARTQVMMDGHLGRNAGDPHALLPASVHATADILNGVLLGGSLFMNMASDFTQTVTARYANTGFRRIFSGVDTYLKAMAPGGTRKAQLIGARSGFIHDEVTGATYAAERWTGMASVGPRFARVIGDSALRLSGLARHTSNARWANQSETMGMMHEDRAIPFDQLDWREMAERYGITADDWDRVRKNTDTYNPKKNVEFLAPVDILKTKFADKDKLFVKFANMVDTESRYAIPDASTEAKAYLRGGLKPDTLPGALTYSFSMFKNYPITFFMRYGRHAASLEKAGLRGRLGFVAALGIGTFALSALMTQFNEITRGRDPMSMDTGPFILKTLLNGGGLGLWGNYLLEGLSDDHGNVFSSLGGPLVSFALDTANMAMGDGYAFVNTLDPAGRFSGKFDQRLVEWLRTYTPGSRLWWARLVLEREIFDQLENWADPKADQKRRNRVARQQRTYGNTYFAPPGQGL